MTDKIAKSARDSAALDSFDIFLSHSYMDKEIIDGVFEFLKGLRYVVYVDWKQDSQLSRDDVTKDTADKIRTRICQSKALFFATSDGAKESRWMPWELGYMDGKKGRAAILPISRETIANNSFKGQEYLSIYPYVTSSKDTQGHNTLWIRQDALTYVDFDSWIKGTQPYKRESQ